MSESKQQWTPGPWSIDWNITRLDIHANGKLIATLRRSTQDGAPTYDDKEAIANAKLITAAPKLVELARKSRAALASYFEDHPHVSPHDCYATGPKSGDAYHDLVRCPGCCAQDAFTSLIAGIDAVLAKAGATESQQQEKALPSYLSALDICSFCLEPNCNGECSGDGGMGD